MRRRGLITLGTALSAGLVLASCSSEPSASADAPADSSTAIELKLVTTAFPQSSGMEALMQHAELTVDDAGCIVLKNGALPVWPKGYTVTGDAKSFAVLDADGRTVAKSDVPFSMGGGSIPDADSGWTNVGCVPDSGNIWMVGKVDTP